MKNQQNSYLLCCRSYGSWIYSVEDCRRNADTIFNKPQKCTNQYIAYSDNFGQFSVLTFINKLSISTSNICHGSSIKLTQTIQGAKGDLFSHVKEEKLRNHHCLHHLDRELPRLEFQNDRDVAESIVPEIAGSWGRAIGVTFQALIWAAMTLVRVRKTPPSWLPSTQLEYPFIKGYSWNRQEGAVCIAQGKLVALLCPVSFSCFWSFLVFVLWELGLYAAVSQTGQRRMHFVTTSLHNIYG